MAAGKRKPRPQTPEQIERRLKRESDRIEKAGLREELKGLIVRPPEIVNAGSVQVAQEWLADFKRARSKAQRGSLAALREIAHRMRAWARGERPPRLQEES